MIEHRQTRDMIIYVNKIRETNWNLYCKFVHNVASKLGWSPLTVERWMFGIVEKQ